MTALIALVGRPNVGKSTLFNQLTRSRDALVADTPGLTRDRRYGSALVGDRPCQVVDTGGLLEADDQIASLMAQQVQTALREADLVLFLVDARAGLTPADADIADMLRRTGRPILLVVNKVDGLNQDAVVMEFAALGFAAMVPVSAAHKRNLAQLREAILRQLPPAAPSVAPEETPVTDAAIRVAVIGRPNVGKSTLINRWLGEDRLLVFDAPGTTRDAIEVPFQRGKDEFLLIDTAGVRKRGRIDETVEKFSVVKSLEAMRKAQVAVLVINAAEGLVEQDLHLLGIAAESGAGLVLALNKWDALDAEQKQSVLRQVDRRLEFAPWIAVYQVSALKGKGVKGLLDEVKRVYKAAAFEHATSALSRILEAAVRDHEPPSVRGRRIKLRFAHKAGAFPPRIQIHGNQTDAVPASYTRYLENYFRAALKLKGVPIKIEYRKGENPYADKPNVLSERQVARRKRMISHRKAKEKR